MKRSYLIQRLDKPWKNAGEGTLANLLKDNPFAFGGGLRNGGLSDEAMGLLRGIFSFDYMGAAEFEFGAVPEALQSIAKRQGDFVAVSFPIALSEVAKDWRDKSNKDPEGEVAVYVLAPIGDLDEIEKRIRGFAGEPSNSSLKESTRLSSVLRPYNYVPRTAGWLELDNGYFFFTDEEMWSQTADLFGIVKVES